VTDRPAAVVTSSPGRRASAAAGGDRAARGFALPALAWFLVFTAGPLVSLFFYSLTDWRRLITRGRTWAFANFRKLASDPVFHQATVNSLIQLVGRCRSWSSARS